MHGTTEIYKEGIRWIQGMNGPKISRCCLRKIIGLIAAMNLIAEFVRFTADRDK